MSRWFYVALPLFGVLIAACAVGENGAGAASLPISTVGASTQCRADAMPGVRVLPSGADVGAALGQMRTDKQPTGQHLLLINMGQRATGGYGLALASSHAPVIDGALTVAVKWQEPQAGTMQTQALTHPCLIVALPKGNYTRIRIVDESDSERFSMTLRPPSR